MPRALQDLLPLPTEPLLFSDAQCSEMRRQIVDRVLWSERLVRWLASYPARERDRRLDQLLWVHEAPSQPAALGHERCDHADSSVAPVMATVLEVPIRPEDVFVDLGAGSGKVTMLVEILSGARTHGIELQSQLVTHARRCATALALACTFEAADVTEADLSAGTVFYFFIPFTGTVLERVLERLHKVAQHHAIVLCTLGFDLPSRSWLTRRNSDLFWLSVYDSHVATVPDRVVAATALRSAASTTLAENTD